MTAIDDGVQTQTKICRICKELKPLTEFYNHKSSFDGKQTFCKQCSKDNGKRRYALEKKGSPFIKRSVRFLRNQVDPSELTHEELVGGYILEDDGTKCNTGTFEDKAKAKFQKELSRRLQRYIKDKTPRALEVIFSIIDSDLVEPADRLKASQWWVERVIGKTPEKLEMTVGTEPHEAIFETLMGGSRDEHRAAIGNAIDAEIISDEQMEAEQIGSEDVQSDLQDNSTGLQDLQDDSELMVEGESIEVMANRSLGGPSSKSYDQNLRRGEVVQNRRSGDLGQGADGGISDVSEGTEQSVHDSNNSAESVADDIVRKRKEAQELKKRIADQKRKRWAARATGSRDLSTAPWLIDWRVDADGLRACLVAPSALTPTKLASIEAHDAQTNDIASIATKRANDLAIAVEKAKERLERLTSDGGN